MTKAGACSSGKKSRTTPAKISESIDRQISEENITLPPVQVIYKIDTIYVMDEKPFET